MRNEQMHSRMVLFGGMVLVNALWTLGNVVAYPIMLINSFLDMKKTIGDFAIAMEWYFQGILLSWPIYTSAVLKLIGYAVCGVMYSKTFASYRSGQYIKRASIIYFVSHLQYAVIVLIMAAALPSFIELILAVFAYIGAVKWDKYVESGAGQNKQHPAMKWPYWQALIEYKKSRRTLG